MVYGLWSMVYGLWSMVYGLWSMVYGLGLAESKTASLNAEAKAGDGGEIKPRLNGRGYSFHNVVAAPIKARPLRSPSHYRFSRTPAKNPRVADLHPDTPAQPPRKTDTYANPP